MKKTFISILIFFLSFSVIHSQKSLDVKYLDEYIKSTVEKFDLPGLSIGIVKDSIVIFNKGYGVKDIRNSSPVNTDTKFAIASLSKAFTSASIGILVDEGKLNWNDKVVDHLPEFKLYDSYITREARIVDLLCHRIGLATFDGDLLWYGTNYKRSEIVKRIGEMPIKNGFRDKYGYQNIMFIVAGEVIEKVSGKTWEEFVQERILTPIKMNNTTISNSEFTSSSNVAIPHLNKKPLDFINYDNSGPAASINSSTSDLLKWLQFWLNEGEWNGEQLLSKKSTRKILTSHTALNGGAGKEIDGTHFAAAGLGWFLYDYTGRKVITHGGGLIGFISKITFVPEDNLGVIVLTNDDTRVSGAIVNKVLDLFMNDKDIDYIDKAFVRQTKRNERLEKSKFKRDSLRMEGTSPSLKLEKYAGIYTDKMYGNAEITFDNGNLSLTLLPSKELFVSKMEFWHLNTFRIKFADEFLPEGFVTFNFETSGNISGFKIELPNPDFHFYNLDFKKKK
ncbi:MAG: serine hydrolase [Ignavibacteriae bacterium]|nr:serine hydrolase [Ignavibacteriota bacterium]